MYTLLYPLRGLLYPFGIRLDPLRGPTGTPSTRGGRSGDTAWQGLSLFAAAVAG